MKHDHKELDWLILGAFLVVIMSYTTMFLSMPQEIRRLLNSRRPVMVLVWSLNSATGKRSLRLHMTNLWLELDPEIARWPCLR